MVKKLLTAQIKAFETRYNYDMGYAHRLLRASRGAFIRFALFSRFALVREQVPVAPWYAARIAATLYEDCGPCTQLVVHMAAEAGLASTTLRSSNGCLSASSTDAGNSPISSRNSTP